MFGNKSHFSREAKMMLFFPLILIIMGILASIFAPKILRQLDIDRCLDNGGKFDYEKNICVGNDSKK
jgi:hypothetical protein